MGIVRSLTMSKRKMRNIKAIECDKDKALSFVCDEVVLLPTGKNPHFSFYSQMHIILFADGEPLVKLVNDGDVVFIEPSASSFKIDVSVLNNLTRIFPTNGRIRVDWDGLSMHINRFGDCDETV
jgi:hypothetical protein